MDQEVGAVTTLRWWQIIFLWLLGSAVTLWLEFQSWGSPDFLYQRDFTSFWMAGKLAWSGDIAAIYDVDRLRVATVEILGVSFKSVYAYPPQALFLAAPFSLLPYAWAYAAWNAVGAGLFMWAARPHWRLPLILVVLTPAALVNIRFGQHSFFYGALWLWAFSKRDGVAGAAAAALTFKPHLGLLVAPEILRRPKALIVAAAVALLLFALSAWLFPGGWSGFFRDAMTFQASVMAESTRSTYVRMMVPPFIGYGYVVHILFAVAAIIMLVRSFNAFTAATATFLIMPYGFHYDMTVVCLGFAALLHDRWADLNVWQRAVAALAFLTPALVYFGTWLVPPILLAGLYVQSSLAVAQGSMSDHQHDNMGRSILPS